MSNIENSVLPEFCIIKHFFLNLVYPFSPCDANCNHNIYIFFFAPHKPPTDSKLNTTAIYIHIPSEIYIYKFGRQGSFFRQGTDEKKVYVFKFSRNQSTRKAIVF